MIPTDVIRKKRDGEALSPTELRTFLEAFLTGDVQDYQMSAFLMAVFFRGLDDTEAEVMVATMIGSGAALDLSHLPGPRVDKHSTGGVGDKVSLALAPLAAELGLYVPMMSGRGLGHTAGTLDKLEAIPGFETSPDLAEFSKVLERVGCAMIGQTAEIAPLDRRLYALRDVTATVPEVSLIAASIMSKKLAEDLTGLLLDVKVGSGAFLPEEDRARDLATKMVRIGGQRGLPTRALLTAMDRPLGRAIGNGLETAEAIECLAGRGPHDLRELVVTQAAEMVALADPAVPKSVAAERAEAALGSGAALERFRRLVEAQGGDTAVIDEPGCLETASHREEVRTERAGVVAGISPRPLGEGLVRLGGGRLHTTDRIDPGVGFQLSVEPGAELSAGDLIGVVHARTPTEARAGAELLLHCVSVVESGAPIEPLPLVLGAIGPEGVSGGAGP